MLRDLFYLLTPGQRLIARRLAFLPVDIFEKITGRRKGNIPPRGMIYTGTGNFIRSGKLYLDLFSKYGGLQPNHRVLDVGSGIGRMALPLTGYLTPAGSYEGFDIVSEGVNWCNKNIAAHHPHFRFHLVNLKNDLYSSTGIEASGFVFPYPDGEFDFVFLTSVFTHMLPEEVDNYMKEIARVLKKGGRCFATFFVFGGEKKQDEGQESYFNFRIDKGHYRLLNQRVQSANVAYSFDYIRENLAESNHLQIIQFLPGSWSNTDAQNERADFQDIIVFEKE
jgi:ubiquinone/menaquinone biosynthesis C-methylase UbiE